MLRDPSASLRDASRNPRIRVLQGLTQAFQTLVRPWPDSGQGSWLSMVPAPLRPLTVFWGQSTDNNRSPASILVQGILALQAKLGLG